MPVVAADPEYFPARLARAEALGIAHRYEPAIEAIDDLAEAFPGSRRILVWRARILSWAREYDRSLEQYAQLHTLNRTDPVPTL